MASKKLTLYTSHRCPWANRAHIALAELGLEFEEVIIDLDKPREEWYLKEVNPRGLVPVLKYGDDVIIESGIITQFLADAFPSHLAPNTGTPEAALFRARINVFVDTFVSKIVGPARGLYISSSEEEKRANASKVVAAIKTDIVPLLLDAAPFFGGSKKPTLAEVNTASFVVRFYALAKKEHGLIPEEFVEDLKGIDTWQKWVDEVLKLESLLGIWNEAHVVEATKRMVEKAKAQAK